MSLRSILMVIVSAIALALIPAGASASVNVTEFSVGSSDQQAGGHPDLTARFKVDKPGQPEVVNNVDINMPEGVFGNPGAIYRCAAAIFVANECQPGAQAGLIRIIANYEGNPNTMLGTTPVYNMQDVRRRRNGAAGVRRPDRQHADDHARSRSAAAPTTACRCSRQASRSRSRSRRLR